MSEVKWRRNWRSSKREWSEGGEEIEAQIRWSGINEGHNAIRSSSFAHILSSSSSHFQSLFQASFDLSQFTCCCCLSVIDEWFHRMLWVGHGGVPYSCTRGSAVWWERVVLRCALCMAKRLRIKRQQSLVDHHMVQQHHTVFAWWWWWRWRMLFHSFLQSVQARYECFYFFFFLHLFCFSLLHHSIPRSFRFQFSRSHQHELLHHVDSTVCVWVCTTDIDYDDNMKSSQLCWGSLCLPFAFIDRRRRFGRREGFEFRCWISNVHDILAFRPTLYVVCFFLLFGLLVDSGLLRSISILLNQFDRNEFIFRLVVRLLMHRLGCCCCDERRNWMANKIEFFFWLVCWLLLAEKSGEWS